MAITAAAGGGNWSAGGSWVGGIAPSTADDVLLTVTSGQMTVNNASCVCRSLNCTGYTNTLTFGSGATLSVGDGTVGAFTLVSGMTVTRSGGTLSFVSTTGTNDITTAGKILPTVTFDGSGGTWRFQDNVTIVSTSVVNISLLQGTLNMNGKTVAIKSFSSTGSATRTLTLGAAAVTVSAEAAWTTTSTGLTVTANTATLSVTGVSATNTVDGGGVNFNGLTLAVSVDSPILLGANTWANLTWTPPGSTSPVLTLWASQTVTSLLTLTGAVGQRGLVQAGNYGTAVTVTAASVALSYVDFEDITAAGAASPFTGTSLTSLGGNTNITQTTPVTRYWVATSGGDWLDTASWSTGSGGAPGASVPLVQDTAVFDANSITSGGQTILINGIRRIGSVDFTNVLNSPTFDSTLCPIYGGFVLKAGMTCTTTDQLLYGRSGGTITTAGVAVEAAWTVRAIGATYTLSDAFAVSTASGYISIEAGTLDTNDKSVTVEKITFTPDPAWSPEPETVLHCRASAIEVYGDGPSLQTFGVSGDSIEAGTSTFTFTGDAVDLDDAWTWHNVVFAGTTSLTFGAFNGGNTFTALTIAASGSVTVVFPASETQTLGAFTCNGSIATPVTIHSNQAGTQCTLSATTATVLYCLVYDCAAAGAASPFQAQTGLSLRNNTNWVFGYRPPLKATGFAITAALADMAVNRAFLVNPTIDAGDFQVDIDGAGFTNLTNLPTVSPASTCAVHIPLTPAEMNGDVITVRAVDQTSPKQWADFFLSILTTTATVPASAQAVFIFPYTFRKGRRRLGARRPA